MREVAPPNRRWKRAVVALCMALILGMLAPARAETFGPPRPPVSRTLPLPPPGTHRLIRVGPQALIREDDRGRLSMVDESTPPPKVGRSLVTTTAFFSILGFGALLTFGAPNNVGYEAGRAVLPP
jgi:hypothetical protein